MGGHESRALNFRGDPDFRWGYRIRVLLALVLILTIMCVSLFTLMILCVGVSGINNRNAAAWSRPSLVNVGAIFTLNSTMGSVAKIAMDAALNDVNSNSSVLDGTKLKVTMLEPNRNAFLGIIEALQLMAGDTIAILGPQFSLNIPAIAHVADELQVPLLSFAATDPTLSSSQYPFLVRTAHSDLYQMSAIAAVVDHYRWKEVIVIFNDDNEGRNGASSLGDELQKRRCKISYKAAQSPEMNRSEAVEMLGRLKQMETRIIVVHTNPDSGHTILSVAKSLGMICSGYVWICTEWLSSDLDTRTVTPDMNSLQGVLVLRRHVPDSDKKRAFAARWNDLVKKEGIADLGLNSYGFYAYDTVWLLAYAVNVLLNKGSTVSFSQAPKLKDEQGIESNRKSLDVFSEGKQLLQTVLETRFVGVTGQFQFDSHRNLIHPAFDVLNILETGPKLIGYWSKHSGLFVEPPETLYSKPPNASNEQLQAVVWPGGISETPRGWAFPKTKRLRVGVPNRRTHRDFVSVDEKTGKIMGYTIDVFTEAVKLLPYGVAYEFIPFGDGGKDPDYDELVELVASGVFDAAVGDISITANRTKIVDFTQPYTEAGLVVLVKAMKSGSSPWTFLKPFTLKMWLATGSFFIIMGVVLWVLEHRVNDDFRGSPMEQLTTILWFSFSTMFFAQRKYCELPWTIPAGHVAFAVLIINSSCTASLTSMLTAQELPSPVTGIESLMTIDDPIGYNLGSHAGSYLIELGIPENRLVALGKVETYADALEKGPSAGGVGAIVDEIPYVELFLAKQHCKYSARGKQFTKTGWGFAFPEESPLGDDMSTAILSLAESGQLKKIHDQWLKDSGCNKDDGYSNELDIDDFWILFSIGGIVSFIALAVFFCRMAVLFCKRGAVGNADDHASEGSRSGSNRLRTFLSFVNEREDVSRRGFETHQEDSVRSSV